MIKTSDGKIPDLHDLIAARNNGLLTSYDIVSEHIQRCEHSSLNAITDILKDSALHQSINPHPGPLSGMPFTLKETFALKDQLITAGSQCMPAIECEQDAEVVRRLKQAGAIILARSTVPEFVMAAETQNKRWGTTKNPLNPSRTSGGSTGGEAALIGSGASIAGLGTDILGSIRGPAGFCGIVGFRPASGLVNKSGAWSSGADYFESFNGVGPMTRSVRDARLIYNIIADNKPEPISTDTHFRLLTPANLNIQVRDDAIQQALASGTQHLEELSGSANQLDLSEADKLLPLIMPLVCSQGVPYWQQLLSQGKQGNFSIGKELIGQLLGKASIAMPLFIWFLQSLRHKKTAKEINEIVHFFEIVRADIYQQLGKYGILILPTTGLLAPKHGVMNLAKFRKSMKPLVSSLSLINCLNLSAITVPAHAYIDTDTGLIPGITLACTPGSESLLLDTAEQLESHYCD